MAWRCGQNRASGPSLATAGDADGRQSRALPRRAPRLRRSRSLYRHFDRRALARTSPLAEVAARAAHGRRRSGARATRPATASRCACATACRGSRSTRPRWGSASSSCRSTSTTTPTTSRGALATPRRRCWSSTAVAWPTRCASSAREHALPADRRAAAPTPASRSTPAERFLPAADRPFEARDAAAGSARDDLLHVGHVGPPEGRDAVAPQHRRERRALHARTRHGARGRPLPVDPAAVAHVRAHRRLLPAARRSARRSSYARGVAQLPEDLAIAGADGHVRGAAHLREIPGAHRAGARRRAAEEAPVRRLRRARLARRAGPATPRRPRCWCGRCARLVARPILARLGGRLRLVVVGGAALDPALARTFIGLGLPMLQGYGMTEASPVISVNRAGRQRARHRSGRRCAGVEVKLADNGELLRARRQRDARLLAQRRGDARRDRRRTAGCTPATSPSSATAGS